MSRDRQLAVWVLLLGLFLIAVYVLRDVLMPFVVGIVIAYFLDPLADRLQRLVRSRTIAVVLILGGFLLALGLALLALIPLLQVQVENLADRLPAYLATLRETVQPLVADLRGQLALPEGQNLMGGLGGEAGQPFKWVADLLRKLLSGGMALVSLLSLLVITPVVSFYLLRDFDDMVARVDSWLPRRAAPTLRQLAREVDDTVAGFIRGQGTVCLVLGSIYAVGLTLVGLDFGLVIGLAAGLVSFIPYVGTLVGLGSGLGVALMQYSEPGPILMVAGVFALGQVLEGYFLTPKLVGEKVGLHPVWVIFALLAGGALYGFTGLLLAVPVAAVIGVAVRFALRQYLGSPMYLGGLGLGDPPRDDPPDDDPPRANPPDDGPRDTAG